MNVTTTVTTSREELLDLIGNYMGDKVGRKIKNGSFNFTFEEKYGGAGYFVKYVTAILSCDEVE